MIKIFTKKIWKDRNVENPGGRVLEFTDGNKEPVTIYRNEGTVFQEGDILNASSFNALEDRIESAFNDVVNDMSKFSTQADWNSTEGSSEILNKPTALSQFENDMGFINDVSDKVDKAEGKWLSSNDFTDEYVHKLNSIGEGAEQNVQSDWNENNVNSDSYIKNKPDSLPASDVYDWAKQPQKPNYTASEVGADVIGSAATALSNAKEYTNERISDLINGAPETLDTLKELADAIEDNQSLADTLDSAIGDKANKNDLDEHINNTTVHMSEADRENLMAANVHIASTHAPSNAEENIINSIYVNNKNIAPTGKRIDISVPTKSSDLILDTITNSSDIGEYDALRYSLSAMQNNPDVVGSLAYRIDNISKNMDGSLYVKKDDAINFYDDNVYNLSELNKLKVSSIIPNTLYDYNVQSICYGNGIFLAIDNVCKILKSTDQGLNWTITNNEFIDNNGFSLLFRDIIFSPKINKFVLAVSDDFFYISDDGESWDKINSVDLFGSSEEICDVCVGKGGSLIFVCRNSSGNCSVYKTSTLSGYDEKNEIVLKNTSNTSIDISTKCRTIKIIYHQLQDRYYIVFKNNSVSNYSYLWYSVDLMTWYNSGKSHNNIGGLECIGDYICVKDGSPFVLYSPYLQLVSMSTSTKNNFKCDGNNIPSVKYNEKNGDILLFYKSTTTGASATATDGTKLGSSYVYVYKTNINRSDFINNWTMIVGILLPSPNIFLVGTNNLDRFVLFTSALDSVDGNFKLLSKHYYVQTNHLLSYRVSEISDAFDYVIKQINNVKSKIAELELQLGTSS